MEGEELDWGVPTGQVCTVERLQQDRMVRWNTSQHMCHDAEANKPTSRGAQLRHLLPSPWRHLQIT